MRQRIERLEISMEELEEILEKARTTPLTEEECAKLRKALETLLYVTDLVGDKDTTIARLRRILFGATTEKIRNVLGTESARAATAPPGESEGGSPGIQPEDNEQPKGHGRNGAADFTAAKRVCVEHGSLRPGERCPKCGKGGFGKYNRPLFGSLFWPHLSD